MRILYASMSKNRLLRTNKPLKEKEIYSEPFLVVEESSPVMTALLEVMEKPLVILRFVKWQRREPEARTKRKLEKSILIPLYDTFHFAYGETLEISISNSMKNARHDLDDKRICGMFSVDVLGCDKDKRSIISISDSIRHKRKIIRRSSTMSIGEIADVIWKIRNVKY